MNYSWTIVHELFMNSQVHELKFMNSKFMNLTNFMNLAISCSWIVHELFMNKCSWTAHELSRTINEQFMIISLGSPPCALTVFHRPHEIYHTVAHGRLSRRHVTATLPKTFAGSHRVSPAANGPPTCSPIAQRPALCPHRVPPFAQNLPHGGTR